MTASCLTEEDPGVLRCERGFELWLSRVIMLPIIVRPEPQAQFFWCVLLCYFGTYYYYIYIFFRQSVPAHVDLSAAVVVCA